MMRIIEPGLVWVIVDGVPRHVSDFAALAPARRPDACCPGCGRAVTLKLGQVLRHHAAHSAGDVCAATQPETALHLNCKLALARALEEAAAAGGGERDAVLTVARRCVEAACDETLITEWARGWDAVAVEHRLGDGRRPDITLFRNGKASWGVEIVATNAVSADKAGALAELGLSWIEVPAEDRFAAPGGWSAAKPLPILRLSGEPVWRCPRHAAAHEAALAAERARRDAEREAQRHASVLRAARVVDVYHAAGVRERFIYRLTEQRIDGELQALVLGRGGLQLEIAECAGDVARSTAAAASLRAAFRADVEHLRRDAASFADSPMRWATGDAAENIVDEALIDRVAADPTPLATTFPRRWFFARERGEWFLPREMRDVRWDRAPLDPFAAHPAWHRARMAVREQPAPEGSWRTPIFAARPIGILFANRRQMRTPAPDIAVVELPAVSGQPRRAIVVLERAVADATIIDLAAAFAAEGVDAVWLSHPRDWTAALEPLAWAPAGRDQHGFGAVLVDGLGVFRADRFARALANGDRRLTGSAIRRAMAERVARRASS
jgi:hypothetical protein